MTNRTRAISVPSWPVCNIIIIFVVRWAVLRAELHAVWWLQVGEWLSDRAEAVEEMTGQLHTAVRLLRMAHDFSPGDTLTRQLSAVASLQDGLQGQHASLELLNLTGL